MHSPLESPSTQPTDYAGVGWYLMSDLMSTGESTPGDQADVEPTYRRKPCTNADGTPKKAYNGRHTAHRMAQRTNRDGNGGGGQPVREYLCQGCRKWHVGHPGWWDDFTP